MTTVQNLKDLAPEIYRKRIVVEGYPSFEISDIQIKEYLLNLSIVCEMVTLLEPVTHCSEKYGWAGWIHWETSGAHFYAWTHPRLFFSVDIYTCKNFSTEEVISFTKDFFETSEIVYKEF